MLFYNFLFVIYSVNHIKVINYFEKLGFVIQIFIAQRTFEYIFLSCGWVILLLRPINSSVISPENETVKEAWIMRSRSVLYYTYKSSFSDFVSHDPINKSTVLSWQFACFFRGRFAEKYYTHIMMLYMCLLYISLNFLTYTYLSYLKISICITFLLYKFSTALDIVAKSYHLQDLTVSIIFL